MSSYNTECKINAPVIADFEQKNNFQLPEDYRYFLLMYNGFTTHAYCDINGKEFIRNIKFWGLNCDEQNDIGKQFEICKNIHDANFLPIGVDILSNLVFLGIKADNHGQIIYRRYNHFKQMEEIFLIADNFQAFLNTFSNNSVPDIWNDTVESHDLSKIQDFLSTHGDWEYQYLDKKLFNKGKAFRDFLVKKQIKISDIDTTIHLCDRQTLEEIENTFGLLKPITYSNILNRLIDYNNFDEEKGVDFIRFLIKRGANPHFYNTLVNYENIYILDVPVF